MKLSIDFTSQDFFRDPVAGLERLRAAGPVVETRLPIIGRIWMTTTQEMASRVLKDSQLFTLRKDDGAIAGLRWWMPSIFRVFTKNMLTVDEPDHTRLRGIVEEAFRRRAVLDMAPRIRAVADQLADELFVQGRPADLVTRYARILPLSDLRTARPAACRSAQIHRLDEPCNGRFQRPRVLAHGAYHGRDQALPGTASGVRP